MRKVAWRFGRQRRPAGREESGRSGQTGLKAIVLSAVVTAVIGSIIRPETVSDLVNAVIPRGGGDVQEKARGFKTVRDDSAAISVSVPTDWTASDRYMDTPSGERVGTALLATQGDPPEGRPQSWRDTYAVVSGSSILARRLKIGRGGEEQVLRKIRDELRARDWTREGCEFVDERAYTERGYLGVYRRWRNCGQVGGRFLEMYAAAPTRDCLAAIQFTAGNREAEELSFRVLDTFKVACARLPEVEPDITPGDPSTP